MIYLFLLTSPDGRFVPRWSSVFVGLLTAHLIDSIFFGTLSPSLAFIVEMVLFLSAVGFQVYRYLRVSNSTQRQQTKWIVAGVSIALTAGFAYGSFWELIVEGLYNPWILAAYMDSFGNLAIKLLTLVVPVCLVFAIQKYRLWDIDLLINRTMVYGALTSVLAMVYNISVVLLQRVFPAQSQVAIVLSTLAIAALFSPLRRRIQNAIDKRFYRRKYDAQQTLAAFSVKMRDEVELNRISDTLLAVVDETMKPAHASLWFKKSE